MKKIYNAFFLLLFISFLFQQQGIAQQQNNPFSVKKKSSSNIQNYNGQPGVHSGSFTSTNGRLSQIHPVLSYKTRVFIQPNSIRQEEFKELRHDEKGMLILAESNSGYGKYFNARSNESTVEAGYAYLGDISRAMKIDNPEEEFEELASWEDEIGMVHLKMQQYYQGVKVHGGQVLLHGSMGMINKMNGTYFPTPDLSDLNPAVTAQKAIDVVVNNIKVETFYKELDAGEKSFLDYEGPESELVIYHHKRDFQSERLTWHIHIRPNMVEHWIYFVDAKTGEIIDKYNNTCTDGPATAQSQDLNGVTQTIHTYQVGNTYYLIDASRQMYNSGQSELPNNPVGAIWTLDAGNTNMQNLQVSQNASSNNNWNNPTAVSAHNNAAITYEYFKNTHSRNSIDGSGGTIISIINVADDNGGGLDNAFWNGKAMFYGNGGQIFYPLAGGLDVGAHEMSHGVTQHTANLEYKDQSGAINEAMSDIVGCMVDREDWQLGEDIIPPNSQYYPTGAMRDMQNPHNGGTGLGDGGWQPKHTSEMYTGDQDNGGVHINSGIINHAYYQLAESISKDKAEKLYYRALSNYMTKSSQFIDCRLAFEQAAKDLYGDGSSEFNAVVTAFFNVGIGDDSGGGEGSGPPGEIPVNPGQDYILFVDTNPSDPVQMYITNIGASEFSSVTESSVLRKPSVTDDGSAAVYIAGNNTIRAIDLTKSPFQEWELFGQQIFDNVAASKDGKHLAVVTTEIDSSIWVYHFDNSEWAKFKLFNPTFSEGVVTYNVLYADALEFDYSGEYVIYDAYNELNNDDGDNIDYWDMGILRVWNNSTNSWGDGDIFKLFSSLPEGVNIGNPTLSKNSPYIIAFDYFDNNNGDTYVLASNLETGELGEIYQNEVLGFPNYSKKDDKLVFTAQDTGGEEVIGQINLQSDKINAQGGASILIGAAKWPVWFSQGVRNLTDVDEIETPALIGNAYPNPFSDEIKISLEIDGKTEYEIQLYNIYGQRVKSIKGSANHEILHLRIDTEDLPKGTYLIKAIAGKQFMSKKVIKAK